MMNLYARLVFIYNMSNSKYSNFDYELSQKMLTLLKGDKFILMFLKGYPVWIKYSSGCYPAILCHIIDIFQAAILPYNNCFFFRLLSCQTEKGFDCHSSTVVQSSLQGDNEAYWHHLFSFLKEAFSFSWCMCEENFHSWFYGKSWDGKTLQQS